MELLQRQYRRAIATCFAQTRRRVQRWQVKQCSECSRYYGRINIYGLTGMRVACMRELDVFERAMHG